MKAPETLLEVRHLSYGYEEERLALDDVSFSVNKGENVALIGHNGSGKSTLAKLLMGLLAPNEGEIFFFGLPLDRKNLYSIRGQIGIVFQNPDNQFVGSTVADDIAFGLENACVPQKEMQGIIESFAEEVGMSAFLGHEPQNLSGGQKQRVAIAGVLAMKPSFIIFDEATAMLDPKGRHEIATLVAKMRKENPDLTILSITHDIEEANRADRVLVLHSGKKVYEGKPDAFFGNPEIYEPTGLGRPFFYQMKDALLAEGIALPSEVCDLDSLREYLCR
ncbi:MAG: energy-coupling factor transporter ATPase [Bacilli bacterium]|nr:energy-coupling factor transporter ATPase [Bacilli bacterium]